MKNSNMIVLVLAIIGLGGCAAHDRALVKGEIPEIWKQVSDKEFIRVRGIGAAPTEAKGPTQKRGQSRNAALVAARYEALALIKGVTVKGGLTVGKLMEKDSHIQEIANRIINGFEEVQTEWTKDDGCVVLMELQRGKLEKLLAQTTEYENSDTFRVSLDLQVKQSEVRAEKAKAAVPGL